MAGEQHPATPLRLHVISQLRSAVEQNRDQLQRMNDLLITIRSTYNQLEQIMDVHFTGLEKLHQLHDHLSRGTTPQTEKLPDPTPTNTPM